MDDDNEIMNDDSHIEIESSGKSGRRSGILPSIIKWIAVIAGALIVIVTVVVITVNIMGGRGKNHSPYPISEEYRDTREILQYYQAIGQMTVHTADSIPALLVVDVAFGYTNNDKSTPQELSARKVEIIDFLRSYFKNKTVAELRKEEKIKIEIRNEMNDNVLTKNKIKDVRFTKYDIVEQ